MLTKAVKYCLEARGLPGFHFARFFWERGVVKSKWSRYDLRPFVRDGIVYYGFRSLPHFLAHSSLLQIEKAFYWFVIPVMRRLRTISANCTNIRFLDRDRDLLPENF